jgi:hypothetical protein
MHQTAGSVCAFLGVSVIFKKCANIGGMIGSSLACLQALERQLAKAQQQAKRSALLSPSDLLPAALARSAGAGESAPIRDSHSDPQLRPRDLLPALALAAAQTHSLSSNSTASPVATDLQSRKQFGAASCALALAAALTHTVRNGNSMQSARLAPQSLTSTAQSHRRKAACTVAGLMGVCPPPQSTDTGAAAAADSDSVANTAVQPSGEPAERDSMLSTATGRDMPAAGTPSSRRQSSSCTCTLVRSACLPLSAAGAVATSNIDLHNALLPAGTVGASSGAPCTLQRQCASGVAAATHGHAAQTIIHNVGGTADATAAMAADSNVGPWSVHLPKGVRLQGAPQYSSYHIILHETLLDTWLEQTSSTCAAAAVATAYNALCRPAQPRQLSVPAGANNNAATNGQEPEAAHIVIDNRSDVEGRRLPPPAAPPWPLNERDVLDVYADCERSKARCCCYASCVCDDLKRRMASVSRAERIDRYAAWQLLVTVIVYLQ